MEIEEPKTRSLKHIELVHRVDQDRHINTPRSMRVVVLTHSGRCTPLFPPAQNYFEEPLDYMAADCQLFPRGNAITNSRSLNRRC